MTDKIIPKPTYKSIVENLAQNEPLELSRNAEYMCAFHPICTHGKRLILTDSHVAHGENCPYRQAVELLQADDSITREGE